MNRSHLRSNLTLLIAIVVTLFSSSHTIAQDDTCALSGRVVDTEGNPFVNIPIAIQLFAIVNGWLESAHLLKDFMPEAYTPPLISHTDAAGRFSVTGIKPGPIQFVAQPTYLPSDEPLSSDLAPDAEVLSVEIGAITFYPPYHKHPPFGGITFAVEPGVHLENVEVTVKPRMRIRGQIVFADGTPLANAEIGTSTRQRDLDGRGSGNSSGGSRTDNAGYFVKYVHSPGLYTVTVSHQELSTTAEPFPLQEGERKDDVLFTFESEPIPTDAPRGRVQASTSPAPGEGVWVVNPANRHAYKSIRCESWNAANSQATAEDAHLVTINDEAEQKWLSEIFGSRPYWIGLTDLDKEGEWRWTSGEPVTYTNWAPYEPMDANRGEEDYVFMGHSPHGEWSDVSPEDGAWRSIRMAILEKEHLPAKPSAEEK